MKANAKIIADNKRFEAMRNNADLLSDPYAYKKHKTIKTEEADTRKEEAETEAKKEAFKKLLRNFNVSASRSTKTYETVTSPLYYEKALVDLSFAATYSTLNKCLHVGASAQVTDDPEHALSSDDLDNRTNNNVNTILSLKRDVSDLQKQLFIIADCNERIHKIFKYNREGDLIEEEADKEAITTLNDLMKSATLGEGADLVIVASLALIEEKARALRLYHSVDLERLETREVLASHIIPWLSDETIATKEELVTPISIVYRTIRSYIYTQKKISDSEGGYTYEETEADDPETGKAVTVYRRSRKFSDLSGTCKNSLYDTFDLSEDWKEEEPETSVKSSFMSASCLGTFEDKIAFFGFSHVELRIINYRLDGLDWHDINRKFTKTVKLADYKGDMKAYNAARKKAYNAARSTVRVHRERMENKVMFKAPNFYRLYGIDLLEVLETGRKEGKI